MKGFFVSLSFLTVFPAPESAWDSPEDLARSVPFFPVVGLLLGAAVALSGKLFYLVFPPPLPQVLMVGVLAVLTRGLHLDGLADAADGLFGAHKGADPITIMRDASVGVFGVAALVLVLLAKFAGLIAVGSYMGALVLFPVMGRWAAVVGLTLGRAAAADGLGRSFIAKAGRRELALGSGVSLALGVVLGGAAGAAAFFGVSGLAVVMVLFFHKRAGGLTGDLLGAMVETSEVLSLIIFSALAG